MARRRLREPKSVYNFLVMETEMELRKNGLKVSNEEFENIMKSDKIKSRARYLLNEVDLSERLYEEYGLPGVFTIDVCRNLAKDLMKEFPEELMPNLEEWLDNKPLSEIKMHGVSVNDIIKMHETHKKISVPDAMICLGEWKAQNFADDNFCDYYFCIA